MQASTQPNRNTNFRPHSESEEASDLTHLRRQMKLNILFLFFHILLIILLYLLQSLQEDLSAYYAMPDVIREVPNLNINRNKYPRTYSASELRYRPFSESDRLYYKNSAKEMFYHGYDSYMRHAFPLDELNPVACTGRGPDTNNP